MKYYLKQIITTTDGKVADEQKWVFDTLEDAVKKFHLLMGANMNEDKVAMCTLIIVVDDGENDLYVKRNETYRKPIVVSTTSTQTTEEKTE